MRNNIKRLIRYLQEEENIDMLDIKKVKKIALNKKMYDLIIFINENFSEYVSFIKEQSTDLDQ